MKDKKPKLFRQGNIVSWSLVRDGVEYGMTYKDKTDEEALSMAKKYMDNVAETSKRKLTHQQTLTKAIQKAEKNGWKRIYRVNISFVNDVGSRRIVPKTTVDDWDTYASIIFDKDFAKALWGDGPVDFTLVWHKVRDSKEAMDVSWASGRVEGYKKHLQQMVIAEDPIKYLEENM